MPLVAGGSRGVQGRCLEPVPTGSSRRKPPRQRTSANRDCLYPERAVAMAVIAALFDFEEGHFFSSVKLARDLNARGHEVFYLGPPSTESMVRQQGFQFAPIFGSLFGSINRTSQARVTVADSEWFGQLVRGEALAEVMRRPKPDLILILSFYCFEALAIQVVHRVPAVLRTPFRPDAEQPRAQHLQ